MQMLTDKEFRHYHGLYNTDPVVQRLCSMEYLEDHEPSLEDELAELDDQVSSLSWENEELRDEVDTLQSKVAELEKKIAVWQTLEQE